MINLPVDESMMRALHRFLHASEGGATLHKVERDGEILLYFRKNGKLDERLASKLIHGNTSNAAPNPVLRLVKTDTPGAAQGAPGDSADSGTRRASRLQQMEDRIPGVLSSQAAQSFSQRRSRSK
ncbi:hypothetical protein [Lacisediminimonas sp.]|uniref:hypothetical protein n=1 Tax=Lacisediminimonas sp. TaxID=3060582 RepID=UPI0027248A37|nr:hypothetical protein [Lacisediminimonas sp.]MDO8299747.1 hypothetical protein [Lacisediminimonas sp.]MDO9217444.1 hypothetical protein [Lacisediminimonas sp.]